MKILIITCIRQGQQCKNHLKFFYEAKHSYSGRMLVGRGNDVTRSDTRVPQSRASLQGLYSRSLEHLGGSSDVKE